MNNSKHLPIYICLFPLLAVLMDIYFEKFGTFPHYSSGAYSNAELIGIILPLIALIIPIFKKDYRENLWSKRNIILLIFVLIFSVISITITYANKEFYWAYWVEQGSWSRDNCPPIRWDVWNIIGQRYKG